MPSKRCTIIIGLGLATALASGCCGGGSRADNPPPKVASVSLALKDGPYPSPGAGASNHIVWRLEPISTTGSDGTSTTTTIDKDYQGSPTSCGPSQVCYFYRDQASNLRPGKWRIQASTPTWSTQCERDLVAGSNIANFTSNRQGCTDGFTFPGD